MWEYSFRLLIFTYQLFTDSTWASSIEWHFEYVDRNAKSLDCVFPLFWNYTLLLPPCSVSCSCKSHRWGGWSHSSHRRCGKRIHRDCTDASGGGGTGEGGGEWQLRDDEWRKNVVFSRWTRWTNSVRHLWSGRRGRAIYLWYSNCWMEERSWMCREWWEDGWLNGFQRILPLMCSLGIVFF